MKRLVGLIATTALLMSLLLTFGQSALAKEEPIVLKIIDVAGDLSSTQQIIQNFQKAYPDKVKAIQFTQATAPELAGKIKAQQDAGRLDVNLVLTGNDGLAAGMVQGLWIKLFPTYDRELPLDTLKAPVKKWIELGGGYGLPDTYSPQGPFFLYNPAKVPNPPKTVDELKKWIEEHPGKFMYARMANSGPGRCFVQALPYLLKDKNPSDPVNGWDKTWAYLKDIGKYIDYYPSGTTQTLKELAGGTRWIIASSMEWDMHPRAMGTVPMNFKVFSLQGTTLVSDAAYWVIPKGVSKRELEVVLDLMKFMLRPEQQALTYGGYIGPVVKGATLSLAPKSIQDEVGEVWRDMYTNVEDKYEIVTQLGAKELVTGFDLWDRQVGSKK